MIISIQTFQKLLKELSSWLNYNLDDPEIRNVKTENFDTYDIHDIKLSSGSIDVDLYLVEPKQDGKVPAIHFIHWLETHAENSNRTQFLPMAKELAGKGVLSVLPDCFWSVDKEEFAKDPKKYMVNWWKTDEAHDLDVIKLQLTKLKLVENFLFSHPKVDSSNVGLGAHDFGAMFACLLASTGSSYKAYAFMAMTNKFTDWFRFGSQLEEPALQPYIDALAFTDPIKHVRSISPSPLHLGFADDDFYVPKERAELLFETANEPKKMKWYSAKHDMNEEAFEDLKQWLMKYLI